MTEKRPLEPKDLYRLRLISDPQIKPDGTSIAFVLKEIDEEKDAYRSNIHLVDLDGAVTRFTSGEEDSAPRWSTDGARLAFVSGRKERPQVYVMPANGGEAIAITDRKLGAEVPSWSPDGRFILFTGAVSTDPEEEEEQDQPKKEKKARTKVVRRSSYKLDGAGYIGNRRRHLFLVEVGSRELTQLTSGDFNDGDAQWSPDGEHIVFASSRSERWDVSTERDIYVIPRSGGEARRLTTDGGFSNPVFSPDGSRIACTGVLDHLEFMSPSRLFSIDRSGNELRDELGSWDGEVGHNVITDASLPDDGLGLTWRDDGIYFLGTMRGEANVYRAAGGSVAAVTRGAHDITDWSMGGNGTIACAVAETTHPAEVCLWTGTELEELTHENDEFLEEVLITKPERIQYSGAKDEQSEGWLLVPRGHESGRHPLLSYIHGGPQAAHGESFFFEYQFLAGQGFGVWFPNIHGSGTYGREYQLSIRGGWGNLDYQDVLAGTEVAAARPWVDGQRLGVIGGSYGGYMTAWVMGHTDLFKAGITERCVSNVVNFFGSMDVGWVWNRQTGAYPEDDVQPIWDQSPVKYAPNVQGALMVMHSEGDQRAPIEQGEQMFNALRRLGKTTKFVIFPEENHNLSRSGTPSRRVERFEYILEWFREQL